MKNSTRGFGLFSILNKYGGRHGQTMVVTGAIMAGLLLAALLIPVPLAVPVAGAAETDHDRNPVVQAEQGRDSGQSRLRITGNQNIDGETLRNAAAEELDDFQSGGFKNADADDAAYQMELVYRRKGYRFATVDYVIERSETGGPELLFRVMEGPRVRVGGVSLSGNVEVSAETLISFFIVQYDDSAAGEGWLVESGIDSAVESIRTYYYTHGYLQAVVSSPRYTFSEDRSTVVVLVVIDEGTQFVVREINFSGGLLPEIVDDLDAVRRKLVGQPYVERQTTFLLQNRISELYGDRGYPEVSVEVERLDNRAEREGAAEQEVPKSGDVVLGVRIDSGQQVTISGLRITGNVKTSEEFIISRLQLWQGDLYSAAKKRASFSKLYRTGLFSLVRISLAGTGEKGKRLLLVELEELPSREVFLELGWGSYEMLRGKVEFRNKNFTGKGRVLSTSAAASLKSTDFSLGFSDPWLLGHDLVLDLPVYYRTKTEPSFDRTEKGISSVVSRRFPAAKATLSLSYLLRYTEQSNVSAGIVAAGDDYNFASVKLQASRDTRDDLFFPGAGYRSLIAVELTDHTLGSSLAFVRFTTTNRVFFSLGHGTVLGARYDTGLVLPTTEDLTLPLAERFYNGGAGTVRSFKESELGPKDPVTGDPLGGSAYNVISLELRRRFGHNFAGSLFMDYGNIAPSGEGGLDRFTTKSEFISATFRDYFSDFRPSIGVGVQYLLPVGPIRLDVAFNPSVDEKQRENTYTIHFTVGMAF
jgi:outer membrane protein assembly complex protein YaeT